MTSKDDVKDVKTMAMTVKTSTSGGDKKSINTKRTTINKDYSPWYELCRLVTMSTKWLRSTSALLEQRYGYKPMITQGQHGGIDINAAENVKLVPAKLPEEDVNAIVANNSGLLEGLTRTYWLETDLYHLLDRDLVNICRVSSAPRNSMSLLDYMAVTRVMCYDAVRAKNAYKKRGSSAKSREASHEALAALTVSLIKFEWALWDPNK